MVGRDGFEPSYSNENRFLTTIIFISSFCVCSLDFLFIFHKMPGIKSLHSRISSLARDCHQHYLLRVPRISPVFIIQSLVWAAILGIWYQRPQSAAFSHSATCPFKHSLFERLIIILFRYLIVNTFLKFFIFFFLI